MPAQSIGNGGTKGGDHEGNEQMLHGRGVASFGVGIDIGNLIVERTEFAESIKYNDKQLNGKKYFAHIIQRHAGQRVFGKSHKDSRKENKKEFERSNGPRNQTAPTPTRW